MKPLWVAIFLVVAVVAFRVAAAVSGAETAAALANFSPMAALVLCGAAFFPKRWAAVVPLAALLVSDVLLNLHYGVAPLTGHSFVIALTFAGVFGLGWLLRQSGFRGWGVRRGWVATLGAAVLASLVFYLATNTFSFFASPSYPPGIAGWWQCLTVGTPGFPPTYLFFRNTLVGDLVFTALILVALRPFAASRPLSVSSSETAAQSVA